MEKFLANVKFIFILLLVLALSVVAAYSMVTVSTAMKEAEYDNAYTTGRQYMEAADYESAIASFEAAYLLNPTDEAALGLAEAWFAGGDAEQAITVLANRLGLYASNETMEELLITYKESIGIYEKIIIGGKEIESNTTAIYLNNIALTEEDQQKLSTFTELVTLEIQSCGLTNIEFLRNCSKLMSLNMDGNPVSDYTPLYNKPELRTLHIKDTAITDFEQLYPLTSLGHLDICGSWITVAQLEALEAALPNTYVLGGGYFLISPVSLGGVDFFSDVIDLDLSDNGIMDTSSLSVCSQIRTLNLANNRISWVSALDKLTTLTMLNLNGNRLSNINALASLRNLTKLYLNDNSVTDISALASMPNLTEVDLTGNPIYHGHEALTGLTRLQKLNLQDSLLKDKHLELIAMDSMVELDLRNNKSLTEAAVTAFAAQYPNCTIYHDYNTAE